MSGRTYPTRPREVHLAGLAGLGMVRFLAVIAHGRGTREVAEYDPNPGPSRWIITHAGKDLYLREGRS